MDKSRGCFDNSHLIRHSLHQGLVPASCTVFSPFSKGNLYRYKRELESQSTKPISEAGLPTAKMRQVVYLNVQSPHSSSRGRKKSLPQAVSFNQIHSKIPYAKASRSQRKDKIQMQRHQELPSHSEDRANLLDRQNRNIHFSQFVMCDLKDSILHSRSKRYFAKPANVRGNSRSRARKSPTKAPSDNFTSIEVANNSKYASSKRIVNTGEGKTHLIEIKKRLEKKFHERARTQSKKMGRNCEKGVGDCGQPWRPWQTRKMLDAFEDGAFLMD